MFGLKHKMFQSKHVKLFKELLSLRRKLPCFREKLPSFAENMSVRVFYSLSLRNLDVSLLVWFPHPNGA